MGRQMCLAIHYYTLSTSMSSSLSISLSPIILLPQGLSMMQMVKYMEHVINAYEINGFQLFLLPQTFLSLWYFYMADIPSLKAKRRD